MKRRAIYSIPLSLILVVLLYSCYKEEDFIIDNDDVIRFADDQGNHLIADGVTLLPVTILLNQKSDKSNRAITVTAVNSKFRDGTSSTIVTANDSGRAVVYVYSTGIGQAGLTATISNCRSEFTIFLLPALPQRILVTSSADNIPYNSVSGTNITAILQRDIGICSAGLRVIYTATDSIGQSHGQFYNVQPTDASGSSKAVFRVSDLFLGTIHIYAKYVRAPGDTLSGETVVFLHQ